MLIAQLPKTIPYAQALVVYNRGRSELLAEGATKFMFQINSSLRKEIADLYVGAENAEDAVSKWSYLFDRCSLDIVRAAQVG